MSVKLLLFMYTYCNLSTGRHGYPCTFNLLQCILLFIFSVHTWKKKKERERKIYLTLTYITPINIMMRHFNLLSMKKLKIQSAFMHKLHFDMKSTFSFNKDLIVPKQKFLNQKIYIHLTYIISL